MTDKDARDMHRLAVGAKPPHATQIDPAPVYALLRRSLTQLGQWQAKYGEHNPQWLPPAGDVTLAEDIDAMLNQVPVTDAVGAGEAPTDAQIMLAELVSLEADGLHASDGAIEVWERARAVLALSPPAIPEVVKEPSDDQIHKVYCAAVEHADKLHQGFSYGRLQALRAVFEFGRRTTTPPPAPSSPAPVAGEPTDAEVAEGLFGIRPEDWAAIEASERSALAAPSTVQGLSDAFAGMDIGQTWTKEHSITYPQSAANIINAALAILAANPTAQPDGGSKA